MLDKKYYEGYEEDGQVSVWSEDDGEKDGLIIWSGFFETILEGCFTENFHKQGIVACYFDHTGFYDDKWEMRYPRVVLDELQYFDESALTTDDQTLIEESKEIIEQLISFIEAAIKDKKRIYIEYD